MEARSVPGAPDPDVAPTAPTDRGPRRPAAVPRPLPPIVEGKVRVLGRGARYDEVGEGAPVLFLHGWALGHKTYRRALRRLARPGLRVLAPALPGFGGNPALPESWESIEGYASWVAAFLAEVGVAGPVVVVGHSFGGGVAIKLAHDHPARVRGIVLVNSIGGSVWQRDGSVVRTMAERPLWDWGLHFPRDVLPGRQLTRVVPVILRNAVPNLVRDPGAFWRSAQLARTADLQVELDELRRRELPVVVLWGEDDKIIPEASRDALCEALGGAQCVTVPGGHGWMFADPESFGEVITNIIGVADRVQHLGATSG